MKTQLVPSSRRQGFTYMTVVVTMIVVGLMLAAYLKLVGVQSQLTTRSQNWNRSVPVLEAGIEEAIAHLNKNGSPNDAGVVTLSQLGGDGWDNHGSLTGPWSKEVYLDNDYYTVTISSWNGTVANFPTIYSTGFVQQTPAFVWNGSFTPFLAAANGGGAYSKRIVHCTVTNNPTYTKAILAKHGIDLNGNNVFTDSYDSGIAGRNINGRWNLSIRRDHGDVASNDTATNIINIGNAEVWGRVATGPGGSAGWLHGAVGDAAWHAGNISGIKAGFFTDDMNVEFTDNLLPDGSAGWVPAASSTLTSGDYLINSVSGNLTIAPNATVRIRVDGNWRFTGNECLTIGSNANVRIYLNCPSADIRGNGVINTAGKPSQCYIFGTSRLTSLAVGGNGEMTAVVNAPYADVTLHGGGSSDMDFSGAMIANTFRFVGHYTVHYDEALGRNGAWRGFTITSWNEK